MHLVKLVVFGAMAVLTATSVMTGMALLHGLCSHIRRPGRISPALVQESAQG